MRIKTLILLAGASGIALGGVANASLFQLPDLQAQSMQPQSFFLNDPFVDSPEPAKFGPVANFVQGVFNGSGQDWIAVQFRILEDPNETYGDGEFASIFFDPLTAPTIDGEAAPGVSNSFVVNEFPGGQVIRFVFTDGDRHSFFETLTYRFTILNTTDRPIGYGLQVAFFPVPTPGTLSLLAVAGLAAARRRR